MAPKHDLEIRNGPKSDDMKITLRVNGQIDHPKADGGSIEGMNVADETVTIPFRGSITEWTVHRGVGSADIIDENGNTQSYPFNELVGYDTREGHGGSGGSGSSSGDKDESVVDKITDVLDGDQEDASGEWNPGDTSGDRDLHPASGTVDRDYVSKRDRTIIVGSGGDCGTVQEALNELPRNIEHDIRIKLKPGVHSNEPGDSLNMPPIKVASAYSSVKIVTDADSREDCVLDVKQANFNFYSGTAQNSAIEGITVRGTVQNRVGYLEIDGCDVRTGERWNKGDNVPIDTYGGHLQLIGGTRLIGDGAAINFVEGSRVSMSGDCVVDVGGPLCSSGQHGGELSISGEADISCNGSLSDEDWDQSLVDIKDPHSATKGIDAGKFADVRR